MRFKTKPIIVEAVQWDETVTMRKMLESKGLPFARCEGHVSLPDLCRKLQINTVEGTKDVNRGDWIIRTPTGKWFVRTSLAFESLYDPVNEEAEHQHQEWLTFMSYGY